MLVVEDNPVARRMLRLALECEGYVVREAGDVRSTLEAVASELPDLVLLDLVLPDGDGVDLAHRLRQRFPGIRMPIVALSGFLGRLQDLSQRGVVLDAIHLKPIEPSRLLATITALVPPTRGTGDGDDPIAACRHVLLIDTDRPRAASLAARLAPVGLRLTAVDEFRPGHRMQPPVDAILCALWQGDRDGFTIAHELSLQAAPGLPPLVLLATRPIDPIAQAFVRAVGAHGLIVDDRDADALALALATVVRAGAPRSPPLTALDFARRHAAVVRLEVTRSHARLASLERRDALFEAQLALLSGMVVALTGDGGMDLGIRDVFAAALDAAGVRQGALFLRNAEGELVLRHAVGFDDAMRDALHDFGGRPELLQAALRRRTPCIAAVPELRGGATELGRLTAELVPIHRADEEFGVIAAFGERADWLAPERTAFLRAVGIQLVQAVELERAFGRLAASESRRRTLMEHANDAIAVHGLDGRLREVNRRFAALFDASPDQLVGRTIAELLVALPDGDPLGPLVEAARPDGSRVVLALSSSRLEVDRETLTLVIGRDVTEQLRARQQLVVADRLATIGSIAATVVHELNNPLATVLANLELAIEDATGLSDTRSGGDAGELRRGLADARDSALRLRGIVRDLGVFSRGEGTGSGHADLKAVLGSALRVAQGELRPRASVTTALADTPAVALNESQLGQVLLSVILHASQRLPRDGHGHLHVASVWRGAFVMVEIQDDGPPLDDEALALLGASTGRASSAASRVGSRGLGLALSQRIVVACGGRIRARNGRESGCTVSIELPLVQQSGREPGHGALAVGR